MLIKHIFKLDLNVSVIARVDYKNWTYSKEICTITNVTGEMKKISFIKRTFLDTSKTKKTLFRIALRTVPKCQKLFKFLVLSYYFYKVLIFQIIKIVKRLNNRSVRLWLCWPRLSRSSRWSACSTGRIIRDLSKFVSYLITFFFFCFKSENCMKMLF